jgi:hypothetical protein
MSTVDIGDGNKKQVENVPVGYWIKKADNLLTEGINAIQSANGINRSGWQVLGLLSVKQMNHDHLAATMQPFTGREDLQELLEELEIKELIELNNSMYLLTVKGRKLFDACFVQQQAFRMKTMQEISAEDYATTLATLQKIVANLS